MGTKTLWTITPRIHCAYNHQQRLKISRTQGLTIINRVYPVRNLIALNPGYSVDKPNGFLYIRRCGDGVMNSLADRRVQQAPPGVMYADKARRPEGVVASQDFGVGYG